MVDQISKRVYQKRKVDFKTVISFGLTDFMGGGGQAVIGAWLLLFYTSYCNLNAAQATLIISIGQIVTAVTGVLIGGISDNFYHTRLGKKFGRRHFFLYLSAPLMFTFALIWVGGQSFWYYLIIYSVYSAVSMVMIPYETLPTEMTRLYNERTKLSTARMFFSSIAGSLATFIPGQLFKLMGNNNPWSFLVNGILFSVIFCLALLITAWNTWELPIDQIKINKEKSKNKSSFGKVIRDYLAFFKIRSCRQHFIIYLCSFTGRDFVNIVFTFFCVYCLHLSTTTAGNLMSLSILGIAVTIAGGYLFTRISPKRLYEIAYCAIVLAVISFILIYKLKLPHVLILMFIVAVFYQLSSSLMGFVPWQVYAFLPDIDEIVSKENRAGSLASLINLLRNSLSAVTTFLIGLFLDANGFIKGQSTQSLPARNAIIAVMIGGLFLIGIAWLVATHFELSKETHQVIIEEITRLRQGGDKRKVNEKTKKVIKELTGYDYSHIWQ